jgi:hypothetical protein
MFGAAPIPGFCHEKKIFNLLYSFADILKRRRVNLSPSWKMRIAPEIKKKEMKWAYPGGAIYSL